MFVVRPQPTESDRRAMTTGADRKGLRKHGPSRSWWEKGALVVDDKGPALVDADGCRVPVPVPPERGKLVEHRTSMNGGGMPGRPWVLAVFNICDRDGRGLAALPTDGFTSGDFQQFARAAGLDYEVQTTGRVPSEASGFVTFWPCIHDQEFRRSHRTRWLERKLIGTKEEWSPYYGGRTYPLMGPAYLED